jgi:hypothetical protein
MLDVVADGVANPRPFRLHYTSSSVALPSIKMSLVKKYLPIESTYGKFNMVIGNHLSIPLDKPGRYANCIKRHSGLFVNITHSRGIGDWQLKI